jgi:hypothetical protein
MTDDHECWHETCDNDWCRLYERFGEDWYENSCPEESHNYGNETSWNETEHHDTHWNETDHHDETHWNETTWNETEHHDTHWNETDHHETNWNETEHHDETTWNETTNHNETHWNETSWNETSSHNETHWNETTSHNDTYWNETDHCDVYCEYFPCYIPDSDYCTVEECYDTCTWQIASCDVWVGSGDYKGVKGSCEDVEYEDWYYYDEDSSSEDEEWRSLEDAIEFIMSGGLMSEVEMEDLQTIRDSLNVIAETALADANATWNLTEVDQGLAMMIENPDIALQLITDNTGVEFESLDELF